MDFDPESKTGENPKVPYFQWGWSFLGCDPECKTSEIRKSHIFKRVVRDVVRPHSQISVQRSLSSKLYGSPSGAGTIMIIYITAGGQNEIKGFQ